MPAGTSNSATIRRPLLPLIFRSEYLERMLVAILDRLDSGKLTIDFPSGNAVSLAGKNDTIDGQQFHAIWQLKSYRTVQRMLRGKSLGFGEAYMEGEWDTPDLTHFLELIAVNMDTLEQAVSNWGVVRLWNRAQHFLKSNTRNGSKRNIAYHYDLGNDFYAAWLDSSMTYSAGLFDENHTELDSAQQNKYRQLAEQLDIQPHHKVLEIGCGWGGFAEFAAKEYGCQIVCLTLSKEQLSYAQARITDAGLDDQVEFRLEDYRDTTGKFDRIVSIEMFEAVGEKYWPVYFEKVYNCLEADGKAALQIISIANDRYEGYRNEADFIQKYIFPGGMLPSPEKLDAHIADAQLRKTGEHLFGHSYALTLETWRKEFLKSWPEISAMGYDEKFKRMWEYYLCYCEAGFRRKTIDVGHYFLER